MKSSRAAGAGVRPRHRHRWVAAAVLSTGAVIAPLALVPAAATTTAPQITTVTTHTGAETVTPGHPQVAATAKLSPLAVAYNPTNGDEAVAQLTPIVTQKKFLTKTDTLPTTQRVPNPTYGQTLGFLGAHVYLIAGATEPNEYHIRTATPPAYGPLVKGDAYLMAGNGTFGQIANPGYFTVTTGGSTSAAAVTNPIAPLSLAFDGAGNLLMAGSQLTTSIHAAGIQMVAKTTCSSSCSYGYSAFGAGNLYSLAGVGMRGLTRTPAIPFIFGVYGYGLAVDAQGNLIDGSNGEVVFVNEQATALTRYGRTLAAKEATAIGGTGTTGLGTCTSGGSALPATGSTLSPYLKKPHPYVDASDNVYLNDNQKTAGTGCVWVLPATSGSLDGMTVTAGNIYSLSGPSTATAYSSGAAANTTAFPNPSAVVTDPAGNVVVSLSGTNPAIRVIAESKGKYYDQTMTMGQVYTVSGAPTGTNPTPGPAKTFKFAGTPVTYTGPIPYGITSLVNGAPGDVLLANGVTATKDSVYRITRGPTSAGLPTPTISSITPPSGSISGGTTVTITGTHLTTVTAVDFGTALATSYAAKTPTQVTAVTPAHALGHVNVTVRTRAGMAVLATGFTYTQPAPSISSVTPTSGSTAGGTSVTIEGANLTGPAVSVDGVPAQVTTVASTEVTFLTPAHAAGVVAVSVSTPGGTVNDATSFTYVVGTPPEPPTGVSVARAGTGAVKISWSAATTTDPWKVTGYTAKATPGGMSCKTAVLTCTVTGLINGATYSFSVVAANAAGTSTSSPSVHLAPGTPPGAPGTPTAVRGTKSATVRWTAPTPTTSGFAVASYTVTSSPTARTCTGGGSTTHLCTVTTLEPGTSYIFTVTATNVVGTGPESTASNPAVPEGSTTGRLAGGYWEVASDGGIFAFGSATFDGSMGGKPLNAPIVGLAATPTGGGYWEVASDGGIFAFGSATFDGSMGGKPLNAPIVGLAATPTGGGYWEVASDGGIFAFGSATFDGSMGGKPLNAPIVGLAATPTGGGYWEVASDGGIFAFGSATFDGSMGGKPLNAPIVGLAATPTGGGYWEVASDGGIFAFGSATFDGSMGGKPLNAPIVGLAATPTDGGYWEVASDGGIFAFGSATFDGSMGGKPLNAPIVGLAATPTGGGYWEVASDGGIFAFGSATFDGSMGGKPLNAPIVGLGTIIGKGET